MELSDFLNSINKTKKNLFEENDPELTEKEYKRLAYIINRILSYFPDTLFHSQAMNMRPFLDGRIQYEYLLHAISKKSRFAKGIKVENPEHLAIVQKYYGYNTKKAREALEILTEEDLKWLQSKFYEGGVKKK